MKLTATHNIKEISVVKIAENIYMIKFPHYVNNGNVNVIDVTTTVDLFIIECRDEDSDTLRNTIVFSVEGKTPFTEKLIYDKHWSEMMVVFLDDNQHQGEVVFAEQGSAIRLVLQLVV